MRAAGLKPVDWLYLAVAVKELAIARARHAVLPVGQIIIGLQNSEPATASALPPPTIDLARLSWALAAAGPRLPWRADCLLRVMAAERWLRRAGAKPDFFLGVAKSLDGALDAHAWLNCGGVAITGGTGVGFTPLLAPEAATR